MGAPNRKGYSREWHLKKRYGITTADVEQMIADQGGDCPICGDVLPEPAHIDHDHETGRVRGVLCRSCNQGLGMYRDDPARLRAAADYLEGS